MPLSTIYICRHGYRLNWVVDPSTGTYSSALPTPTGIPNDPILAAYGVEQANQLAEKIATLDPIPQVFYSSPFYRCLQTIKPAHDSLRKHEQTQPIRVDPGVGEFFGTARFVHPAPAPIEVLVKHFDLVEDHTSIQPSATGESIDTLHNRFAYALHRIIEKADAEGTDAIVVCSHAAGMITMGRVLTGRMPEDPNEDDFKCGTCALSTFKRRKTSTEEQSVEQWDRQSRSDSVPHIAWKDNGVQGGWDCVVNGDCSHLKNGEERTWKMSMEGNPNAAHNLRPVEEIERASPAMEVSVDAQPQSLATEA